MSDLSPKNPSLQYLPGFFIVAAEKYLTVSHPWRTVSIIRAYAMKIPFFFLILFPLLTACITSHPFDESYRESIKSVTIQVQELPKFSYLGPGYAFKQGLGNALGGAIGGGIAALDDGTSEDEVYVNAFREKDYDLREVMKNKFAESLQRETGIESKEENSDAVISIKVVRYGLAKGWGFTDMTAPFIFAQFEMKDGKDKVIWREINGVDSQSYDCAFHSGEEWLADPALLVAEYNKSIEVFIDKVAASAKPNRSPGSSR